MIRAAKELAPPASRLVAGLAARGLAVDGWSAGEPAEILVVGHGIEEGSELASALTRWGKAGGRVLVVSSMGCHPDARAAGLRALWRLEERIRRSSGLRPLVLRLAPLPGPASPLWLRLRSRPLERRHNPLVCPVVEEDVLQALERWIRGEVAWTGWHEVAGAEVFDLAELSSLAAAAAPPLPGGSGAWEPSIDQMEELRLAEPGSWLRLFGLDPRPLSERVATWAA